MMNLPRKDKNGKSYISYSQITTWKRSKKEYINQYFFKEPFTGNAYTDFGSMVGEALELNDFNAFNESDQETLNQIPRYDLFEREIKLDLGEFYVKGFIDTMTKDGSKIADYKTGDISKKTKDYESDEYTQLDIYALGLLNEGFVDKLPDAEVILIGRTGNAFRGEKLKLSGEHKVISRKLTKNRNIKIIKEIHNIAKEISAHYEVFLKMTS